MRDGELPDRGYLLLAQHPYRNEGFHRERQPLAHRFDRVSQAFNVDQPRLLGKRIADGADVVQAGLGEQPIALHANDDHCVIVEKRLDSIIGFQVPRVRLEQCQRIGIDADLRRLPD